MPQFNSPPDRFIGITGGSCSGKSTLEHNLQDRLGDRLALFPFDDMFVGRPALAGKVVTDWEDPALYRWNDFVGHMRDLKAGRPVTITANSRESKAAELTSRHIEPRSIVVVAGFLTFHNPEVAKLFDTRIYLDLPEAEIISRRLARADSNKPWDSERYVNDMLIPGHHRVVVPQRALADYILDATLPPDELADQAVQIIAGAPDGV